MNTILASTDPIALDYYGAKYILYPLSRNAEYHNPDNNGSSIRNFLELAQDVLGVGTLGERRMKIYNFEFEAY